MHVVILCGGMGTRLREYTETIPKPMVLVGGRPILWHIMRLYAHHGFTKFVLCLGYLGARIKEYFLNFDAMNNDFSIKLGDQRGVRIYGREGQEDYGWDVTLVDTGLRAMTGARVRRAMRYVDGESFMLTYGDGVADIDLKALSRFHESHGRIGTVTGVRPLSRFGEIDSGPDDVVRNFLEKPKTAHGSINGGFFVLRRKFFDYLEDDDGCVLERAPLERLVHDGELKVYQHDGYWQCMDTYRDYERLNQEWDSGKPPWKVW